MLSYLIVTIRPKNLVNRLQTDKKLTDMKTYRWAQKQRKKISLVNAGPPDRVSVLFTKCGACHPKGLIVASSHKIKQIIIKLKFIYVKAKFPFC